MTTLTREQIETEREIIKRGLKDNAVGDLRGTRLDAIFDMALSSLDLLAERERLVGALELAGKRLDIIADEIHQHGFCSRQSLEVYGFATDARAALASVKSGAHRE